MRLSATIFALSLLLASGAQAQLTESAAFAADLANHYRVQPDITYLTANNHENKLDLYLPRSTGADSHPTLIYLHGGGWVGGSREASVLRLLPYLERGWAVVNVSYRLGRVSLAPAAVEDCRCALRWVIRNASEYGLDPERIVVSGHSAGGHLSLTTGMLTEAAGLERQCPGSEELRVAGIVNWFGITDVADLLAGPNIKTYAVAWLAGQPDRMAIAKRVSPIHHVHPDLPPILTVHGDADSIVPYSHAVALHDRLAARGLPNQLVTIPGGGHGGFSRDETLQAFHAIWSFIDGLWE